MDQVDKLRKQLDEEGSPQVQDLQPTASEEGAYTREWQAPESWEMGVHVELDY